MRKSSEELSWIDRCLSSNKHFTLELVTTLKECILAHVQSRGDKMYFGHKFNDIARKSLFS